MRSRWFYPSLGAALLFLWQLATVRANYGGNWTALYCTGANLLGVPPALDSEHIYLFPHSKGYDGQNYHYVAHDPFLRRGFARYIDSARVRHARILVPGLAYVLALGNDR